METLAAITGALPNFSTRHPELSSARPESAQSERRYELVAEAQFIPRRKGKSEYLRCRNQANSIK